MDDSIVIEFATPIVVGAASFPSVTLTVPLVKHLRAAAKAPTGIDAVATMIQLIGKVPASVVDEMTQPDFQKASDFLERFGSQSPAAGAGADPSA